jgi:hypothetical protein
MTGYNLAVSPVEICGYVLMGIGIAKLAAYYINNDTDL